MSDRAVCYLDLDGVLADFTAGAIALHRLPITHADVDCWDFHHRLGFTGEREKDFWAPLGYDFWAELPKTREHDDVLAAVREVFEDRVVIATAPAITPGCVEGKVAWIKKHLPEFARKFVVGSSKHLMAGPGKVLVDDYEINAVRFEDHGGRSVLFPRLYNSRAHLARNGHFFDMDMFREWLRQAACCHET